MCDGMRSGPWLGLCLGMCFAMRVGICLGCVVGFAAGGVWNVCLTVCVMYAGDASGMLLGCDYDVMRDVMGLSV